MPVRQYFYIVSVLCLSCGAPRMITRIALRKGNLDRRTMRETKIDIDASLIDAVDQMPPCPTCRKIEGYDPARTDFLLRRETTTRLKRRRRH